MKYLKYLKYILVHKWYVFQECWKVGLYIQAFTHDLSKFSPWEFPQYAKKFFSTDAEKHKSMNKIEEGFKRAWLHHQKKNLHHWQFWVVDPIKKEAIAMPKAYLLEMVCDWNAMAKKCKDTAKDYYEKNKDKMILHAATQYELELLFYD